MKFAKSGLLYRGSKPVMWSVVEKTALAEAEVEYQDTTSDQIWVKFPVRDFTAQYYRGSHDAAFAKESEFAEGWKQLKGANVVIWTTTPWTIPGNRAISFSSKIKYGLYEVTAAPEGNWAKPGDKFVLSAGLAPEVLRQQRSKTSRN